MSEYTGRGPTKARAHINDDVVTVVLRDTLTKGERSLVTDDLDELMSDNHIDPDVAVEVFVLAPADARDGTHRDGPQAAGKTPGEAMAGAGSWVGARCKRRVPWADVDAPRGGRSALTG